MVLSCNRLFFHFHSHTAGRIFPQRLSEERESLSPWNPLENVILPQISAYTLYQSILSVGQSLWLGTGDLLNGLIQKGDPHLELRIGSASPRVHRPTREMVGMEWNLEYSYKEEWRKGCLVESWLGPLLGRVTYTLIISILIWIEDKNPSFPSGNEHIQCPYLGF